MMDHYTNQQKYEVEDVEPRRGRLMDIKGW
jgi:hypothetical protein